MIPLFFVFSAIVIAVLVIAWRNRRADVWKQFAATRRLRFRESTWTKPPLMSGFYRSTAVTITIEHRGSGKSRQAYTQATAFFGADLPRGMKLGKEGFGTTLAKLFGAQDIQIGLPDLDAALRIQGEDPVGISKLLQTGRVGRTVVRFISDADEAVITHEGATLVTSGHASRADQLQSLLDRTTHAVRTIEHDLRWDPRRAGDHVPTPRREPPKRHPRRSPDEENQADAPNDGGDRASGADRMIADLASQGVTDSQGAFTLDRDVARERMREFQLADPAAYVLELVQAATLKGAERLDFVIDGNDMRLWFDGPRFTEEDFDVLYGSLFSSQADADTRARQRLAIGTNAALGSEPKYIHVSSKSAEEGARMILSPGDEDRIEPAAPQDLGHAPGTQIHVRSRLGQRLAGTNKKVADHLETRCRYADAEITLNGKRISGGATLDHAFGVARLEGDGLTGECGLTDRLGDRAEVRMVTDGVWISSHDLPGALPGLVAVVASGRFTKDLSQSEIVRDDAWQDALDAVYRAEGRAVDTFAAQLVQLLPQQGFPTTWALSLLRAQCRSYSSKDDFRPGGAAEDLAQAPLWPTVVGTLASLRTLLALREKTGQVDYADYSATALHLDERRLARGGLAGHKVLLLNWLTDPRDGAFLAHLFGGRLRSVTDRLLGYLA